MAALQIEDLSHYMPKPTTMPGPVWHPVGHSTTYTEPGSPFKLAAVVPHEIFCMGGSLSRSTTVRGAIYGGGFFLAPVHSRTAAYSFLQPGFFLLL